MWWNQYIVVCGVRRISRFRVRVIGCQCSGDDEWQDDQLQWINFFIETLKISLESESPSSLRAADVSSCYVREQVIKGGIVRSIYTGRQCVMGVTRCGITFLMLRFSGVRAETNSNGKTFPMCPFTVRRFANRSRPLESSSSIREGQTRAAPADSANGSFIRRFLWYPLFTVWIMSQRPNVLHQGPTIGHVICAFVHKLIAFYWQLATEKWTVTSSE